MDPLIINLYNPEDALCPSPSSLSPSSVSMSDMEVRIVPYTWSPLDSCRGGKQKTTSRVRDGRAQNKKTVGGNRK